jgi:hypothetical protein
VAVKVILILAAAVVAFVFTRGDFDFWVVTESDPTPAIASATGGSAFSNGLPAGLGEGPRNAAQRHWLSRMNALCARRNRRENALAGPEDTTLSLARYSARTLWIWDSYARQARTLRAPRSYAAEASWFQMVDDAKRRGIDAVLQAARSEDYERSHIEIGSFRTLSEDTYAGLVKIGLGRCAEFNP